MPASGFNPDTALWFRPKRHLLAAMHKKHFSRTTGIADNFGEASHACPLIRSSARLILGDPFMRTIIATASLIIGTFCIAANASSVVNAAPTVPAARGTITINVEKMCCGGCAKRIATQLYDVPGVAEVESNIEAKTVTVRPEARKTPSPKAIWEAVERGKDVPLKLVSPQGTFTKKPRS